MKNSDPFRYETRKRLLQNFFVTLYEGFVGECVSIIEAFVPRWNEPDAIARVRRHIRLLDKAQHSNGAENPSIANRLNKAARRLQILTESRLNLRNARDLYNYANQRLKIAQNVPTLQHEGQDFVHDHDNAELLGRLFATVFSNIGNKSTALPFVPARQMAMEDSPVSFEKYDIYAALSGLKPKHSVTADGIPPIFLKNSPSFYANLCL